MAPDRTFTGKICDNFTPGRYLPYLYLAGPSPAEFKILLSHLKWHETLFYCCLSLCYNSVLFCYCRHVLICRTFYFVCFSSCFTSLHFFCFYFGCLFLFLWAGNPCLPYGFPQCYYRSPNDFCMQSRFYPPRRFFPLVTVTWIVEIN